MNYLKKEYFYVYKFILTHFISQITLYNEMLIK